MSMSNRANELICRIMELEFTCLDLQLFLNTHPGEPKATEVFNDCSRRLRELKQCFDKECGPLQGFGWSGLHGGCWVNATPWPWEC